MVGHRAGGQRRSGPGETSGGTGVRHWCGTDRTPSTTINHASSSQRYMYVMSLTAM